MTEAVHEMLVSHLVRPDGQEDLCFGLWKPSQGKSRLTALVHDVVLPGLHERQVHGNASFNPTYLERALRLASNANSGLAIIHSHPGAHTWQGMSLDDQHAEAGRAGSASAVTGMPLVGLTLAGRSENWSARFWERVGQRAYEARDCESVRVVGKWLDISRPEQPRLFNPLLVRTLSAWGETVQSTLEHLRVGVIGLGSVGSIVAESIARMGIGHLLLMDFDVVEEINLDRLLHATDIDAQRSTPKVELARRNAIRSATNPRFIVEALQYSVVEETGFRAAVDCDVLFSCVDRPWPRSALNLMARAHLIPVIDGGLRLEESPSGRGLRRADLRAHTVTFGRPCLECIGQLSPELVSLERDGYLDDPAYIASLPSDHPFKARQNVFGFSVALAGLELMQMLAMFVTNQLADPGAQTYHFVPGFLEKLDIDDRPGCLYTASTALGDAAPFVLTGRHALAQAVRERTAARKASLAPRRRRSSGKAMQ